MLVAGFRHCLMNTHLQVASLHPGCIELPQEQDDKATVNSNCVQAAARGDQVAVEAFLTGRPRWSEQSELSSHWLMFRLLLQVRVCDHPG